MKHGFDLTDFGENWPHFKAVLELRYVGRGKRCFEWASERGLTMVTQNNPDTGEYGPNTESDFQREDEVGFASYIGLEGPDAVVLEAVKRVRQYADYIKGESPNERAYI